MQPLCSLDLTLLQHVSATIGHPQVFHFLPKLLPAFTIGHTFFPIALFYIYLAVTFLLTLVNPPYTVTYYSLLLINFVKISLKFYCPNFKIHYSYFISEVLKYSS
jgi:hypothetical protein